MNLPNREEVKTLYEAMDVLAKSILAPLAPLSEEDQSIFAAARLDHFAAKWLKIRTKKAGPAVPFAFNWVQRDFLSRLRRKSAQHTVGSLGWLDVFRGIRANVLKPRQLGFSTFIAALFFMDGVMNPGRTTVVVTHLQKMSQELIKTYRLFWSCLPASFKAGLKLAVDSKFEFAITFPPGPNGEIQTESRFIIWTEKGEDWRGGVIHNLLGSEAAYYNDYMRWKTAFYQAVDQDEGNIILETTANGMNAYHDDVSLCLSEDDASFDLIFYPWHVQPEYQRPWNPLVQPPPTDWEAGQMALHGWTLEQLAWRRWKIKEGGSEEKFFQEFPATVDEAFLMTGRPFFPMAEVKAELNRLGTKPAKVLAEPIPHTLVWETPVFGEVYLLVADIAEGRDAGAEIAGHPDRGGADFCCGYVLHTRSLRVVAAIHGRIPSVEFARLLDQLGRMYGACLAPERNNHGHTVVHVLESSFYPWLYRHQEYDTAGNATFLKAGFPTDSVTRPKMLDTLWQAIKAGQLGCPHLPFWREASHFHRHKKTGKPEAIEGYHDDCVITMAIGVYLCTLGHVAWGQPAGEWADATGLPVSGHEVPSMAPVFEGVQIDPPTSDVPVLAVLAQQPKPQTCGACQHCLEGACHIDDVLGGRPLRVDPGDPGCWAHLVRHDTLAVTFSGFGPAST